MLIYQRLAIHMYMQPDHSNVLMEYGVEVYYLKLSTGTDDTATQIDVILDALKPKVDGMMDKLNASGIVALSTFIDDTN